MSQHAESTTSGRSFAQVRSQVAGVLATIVRWAGLLVAVILVIRVLLTLGGANPANGITSTITSWSDPLAWGFKGLFTPSSAKARVLVNYGVAALFWLIISAVLARIIRRLGGPA
jgi:hypothetical protein